MFRWLFRRVPLLVFARRNLSRSKARSLLATLGIVIGVVAISSLGLFGLAFTRAQLQDFQMGSNVIVSPGEDAEFERLGKNQIARLEAVTGNAPMITVETERATVTHLREEQSVELKAISDPQRWLDARQGRIPGTWRSGVLVGSDLARQMGIAPGDSVTVDGQTYRVRAVLERAPQYGAITQPNSALFLPSRELEGEGYDRVTIRADSPAAANATAVTLDTVLNGRRERFEVRDFQSTVERFRRTKSRINMFTLGAGAISLIVAGVSILNVMLMSVLERREEIGVLRAVGYHRSDVLRLILYEAALLGLGGAIIGTVLSLLFGMAINQLFLDDPMAFNAQAIRYIALGFVFGIGSAVLSGLYPAWKAANARPVEALRD